MERERASSAGERERRLPSLWGGLPVGRMLGVPIRLHLSWLVLFVFVLSLLRRLFAQHAGHPAATQLALITTLLLLFSALLHELGHAVMARRLGIEVEAITLFLTGGMTKMRGEAETPGHELKIALAGPAASLAIALATGGLALASGGAVQVLWLVLAGSNAIIAVFNLLPSFPLDGGRILRALLWFLQDDMLRATHSAAWIGRLLGAGLMLLAVVVAITANLGAGLVLGTIGWMMERAAVSSYLQTALHYALTKISIGDIMLRTYRTVSPQLTLDIFVGQYLLGQTEQGYPVVQAERLLGMVTVRNLRSFSYSQWSKMQVSEVMIPSSELPVLRASDPAKAAFHELIAYRFEQLPVTDGDQLLGVVRRRDLLAFVHQTINQHS